MKSSAASVFSTTLLFLLTVLFLLCHCAAAAELTEADLVSMPSVSVSYAVAENGESLSAEAVAVLSPFGKSYWVTVPEAAFAYPMTLTVTAAEDMPCTYDPGSGTELSADIETVDYQGSSTVINVYENDVIIDTYYLYISAAEIPTAVESVEIPVYYVDAADNSNVLYFDTIEIVYGEDTVITADTSLVPSNYVLTGSASVTVTLDDSGIPSQEWITFTFEEPAATEAPQATAAQAADPTQYADYTVVSADAVTAYTAVNIRSTPDSSGANNILYQVDDDTAVWVYGAFTLNDTLWAYIRYNETDCYVWYSLLMIPDDPTQYADYTAIDVDAVTAYTVVNFRSTPDSSGADNILYQVDDDTAVWVYGAFTLSDTLWAYIRYNETDCYVWYSLLMVPDDPFMTAAPTETPQPTEIVEIEEAGGNFTLTVQYRNTDGEPIAEDQVFSLGAGTYSVSPDTSYLPEDYELSDTSESQYIIIVSESGVVSPAEVVFVYTSLKQQAAFTPTPTATPTAAPTESTAPVDEPAEEAVDIASLYADYQELGSYADTNTNDVRLRTSPYIFDDNIAFQVSSETKVYVYGVFTFNDILWAHIHYNDTDCYVWFSLINLEVVNVTPTPTATPTATPLSSSQSAETSLAAETTAPTAVPAETAVDETADVYYAGYAITTEKVALRSDVNFDDTSILEILPADTLLYIAGLVTVDGTMWAGANTCIGVVTYGLLPYDAVSTITDAQAQEYINNSLTPDYTATPSPTPAFTATPSFTPTATPHTTPTPAPTAVPSPASDVAQPGYYLIMADGVPLRQCPDSSAAVSDWLNTGDSVTLLAQLSSGDTSWYICLYNGSIGYLQSDQLQQMTLEDIVDVLLQ